MSRSSSTGKAGGAGDALAPSSSAASRPLLAESGGKKGDGRHNAKLDGPMSLLRTLAPGRKAGFDRVFLRRFALLVRVGFGGWCTRMAWRAYLIWFLTAIAGGTMFATQMVIGPFIASIVHADSAGIIQWTATGSIIFVVCTCLLVCNQYLGEKLALDWRKNLVSALHKRYLVGRQFYYLNNVDARVDNADQRITQDVAQVTILAGRLAFGNYQVMESVPFMIIQSLASITFVLTKVDWMPLACSFGYFGFTMVVMTMLIIPVAKRVYIVNENEGRFRFLHARIKEFSEAITLYQGQRHEQGISSRVFSRLYWQFRSLFKRQFFLNAFAMFQTSATLIFSAFMIGLVILRDDGKLDGEAPNITNVQQSVTALRQLVGSLTAIPAMYSLAGALCGYCQRVGQLFEALGELAAAEGKLQDVGRSSGGTRELPAGEARVVLRDLTVCTPDGHQLMSGVNLAPPPGTSVLIMGKSGSGKSSLLRVIAGLWPPAKGSISRPPGIGRGGMFFVPQRPYITQGSLRQQIIYPHTEASQEEPDAALSNILRSLDLGHLLTLPGGLSAVREWDSFLSVGEQQRLGFARLFYHRPAVAVMDESTSALNVALEARCMRACHERHITCISVGHRPTLVAHHEQVYSVEHGTLVRVHDTSSVLGTDAVRELEGAAMPGGVGGGPAPGSGGSPGGMDASTGGSASEAGRAPTLVTAFDSVVEAGSGAGGGAGGGGDRRSLLSGSSDPPESAVVSFGAVAPSAVGVAVGGFSVADDPAVSAAGGGADPHGDGGAVDRMRINAAFFRRLRLLLRIGFPRLCSKPVGVLIVCCLASVVGSGAVVSLAFFPGILYEKVLSGNFSGLLATMLLATAVTAGTCLVQAWYRWLSSMVQLYWYRALVERAEAAYFKSQVLYGANHITPGLDNMDQRIAEDCRKFTLGVVGVFLASGTNVFGMCLTIGIATYYAAKLGAVTLLVCYGYTVIVLMVTYCLMRPVVPATYAKNMMEGSFRFAAARVREFGESIAFYTGQDQERANANFRFAATYDAALNLIKKQFFVSGFDNFNGLFSNLFVYVTIAFVSLFSGEIAGEKPTQQVIVTQAALLLTLMGDIVQLPRGLSAMAPVAGFTHRVGHMLESLERVQKLYDDLQSSRRLQAGDHIRADNVTVRTPSGSLLFANLNLDVPRGSNLLIMGPSGVGKTSLIRVLCGLWPVESGTITSPQFFDEGSLSSPAVFLLPQRPYVVMNGTLREQLLYPWKPPAGSATKQFVYDSKKLRRGALADMSLATSTMRAGPITDPSPSAGESRLRPGAVADYVAGLDSDEDAGLVELLRELDLTHLLAFDGGLDALAPWEDILSVGEQQRLGFARLLHHKPAFALMDESTSALDVATERKAMRLCAEAGITCISVAHRPTLRAYHSQVLHLSGPRDHTMEALARTE